MSLNEDRIFSPDSYVELPVLNLRTLNKREYVWVMINFGNYLTWIKGYIDNWNLSMSTCLLGVQFIRIVCGEDWVSMWAEIPSELEIWVKLYGRGRQKCCSSHLTKNLSYSKNFALEFSTIPAYLIFTLQMDASEFTACMNVR